MMKRAIEPKPEFRFSSLTTPTGFTLIELLSVVAIISVLIALLLPAIQSSREQARRFQCSNNLLQLSLATHNYLSAHRVFPPGSVNEKGPVDNGASGYKVGWTVQILPFLEQRNLWNQFNFRVGTYDSSNVTVQRHHLNSFSCPSDPSPAQMPGSSYAGCYHDAESPIDRNNTGVLFLNSKIQLDDITDGAAYTILIGEGRRSRSPWGWARGNRSTLRNTGHPINSKGALYTPTLIESIERQPGEEAEPEPDPVAAPDEPDPQDPTLWYVGGFSSFHPGGANFVFCDGSVRFVKQRLNAGIFRALGNRADGLLISDDQF